MTEEDYKAHRLAITAIAAHVAAEFNDAAGLRQSLSVLAIKLDKTGQEVTTDILRDFAAMNADERKQLARDLDSGTRNVKLDYDRIVAGFPQAAARPKDEPHELIQWVYANNLPKIQRFCDELDIKLTGNYIPDLAYLNPLGSSVVIAAEEKKFDAFKILFEADMRFRHPNNVERFYYAQFKTAVINDDIALVKYLEESWDRYDLSGRPFFDLLKKVHREVMLKGTNDFIRSHIKGNDSRVSAWLISFTERDEDLLDAYLGMLDNGDVNGAKCIESRVEKGGYLLDHRFMFPFLDYFNKKKLNVLDYIYDEKKAAVEHHHFRFAAGTGDPEILKYVRRKWELKQQEKGESIQSNYYLGDALGCAIDNQKTDFNFYKYFCGQYWRGFWVNLDVRTRYHMEQNVLKLALSGRDDIIQLFIDKGFTFSEQNFRWIANYQHLHRTIPVLYLFHRSDCLALASALKEDRDNKILSAFENMDKWQRHLHISPLPGLECLSSIHVRPSCLKWAADILNKEMKKQKGEVQGNVYAYNLSVLFGTEDRILRYLQKWGSARKQPLHDLTYKIIIPQSEHADWKAWGDAVLKFGPDMANLVKFADKLPRPLATLNLTRAEIAKDAYPRSAENPQLAALCFEFEDDENTFNRALGLWQTQKEKGFPVKNIPDFNISGEQFGFPGARFIKLKEDDPRGLFLGEYTDCCQSIGNSSGAPCAIHGFTSDQSGFYAVLSPEDDIIGQTWAWRGTKGELVFDSLETLGTRVSVEQWKNILNECTKSLNDHNPCKVTEFLVGNGGDTPNLGAVTDTPATPVDYSRYRDSRTQYSIWHAKAPQPILRPCP